jgi:hypothetical protein
MQPTDEKLSGETARPDAWHRRSRAGATGWRVAKPREGVTGRTARASVTDR